jgi:hypothetical protein
MVIEIREVGWMPTFAPMSNESCPKFGLLSLNPGMTDMFPTCHL